MSPAAAKSSEVDAASAMVRRRSVAAKIPESSPAECFLLSMPNSLVPPGAPRPDLLGGAVDSRPLQARSHRSSCPDLLRGVSNDHAAELSPLVSPSWLSRKRKVRGALEALDSNDCEVWRFRSCASISSLCRQTWDWPELGRDSFEDARSGSDVDANGGGFDRRTVSPASQEDLSPFRSGGEEHAPGGSLDAGRGDACEALKLPVQAPCGSKALDKADRETPATHASQLTSPFGDSASTGFSDRGDCALSLCADDSASPSLLSEDGEGPAAQAAPPGDASWKTRVPLAELMGHSGGAGHASRHVAQALFPAPPAPYLAQLLQLQDVYEAAFLAVEVLPERYLQRIQQLDALQSLVGPELYTRCSHLATVRAIYVESCDLVARCKEELLAQLVEEATRHREESVENADDDDWPPEDAFSTPLVRSFSGTSSGGGFAARPAVAPVSKETRDPRAILRRVAEQLQAVKALQSQVGPDLLEGMAELVAELCRGEAGETRPERIREFVDHFLHAFFSCRVAAELQREHFLTAVEGRDCGAILSSHVAVEHLICRAALDAQELSLHHLGVAPPVEIYISELRSVDQELKAFLLAAARSEGPSSVGWSSSASPAGRADGSEAALGTDSAERRPPWLATPSAASAKTGAQSPVSSPSSSLPASPLGESPREPGLPGTVRFPCFSSYAYSGIFELVKNAMRASVDAWAAAPRASQPSGDRVGPREEGGSTWRSTCSSLSNASLSQGSLAVRAPWRLVTLGRSRRLRKLPGRQLECVVERNSAGETRTGHTRVVVLEENAPSSVKVNMVKVLGSLVIQIEDSGRGLGAEELAKIWSFAYSTAHEKSTKGVAVRNGESDEAVPVLAGCGVGLPMSRVHAQSLGGDIFMESAQGVGTCAYMCLSNLQEFRNEALKTHGRNHRELLDGLHVQPLSCAETTSMLASTPPPMVVKARGVGSLPSAFSQLV